MQVAGCVHVYRVVPHGNSRITCSGELHRFTVDLNVGNDAGVLHAEHSGNAISLDFVATSIRLSVTPAPDKLATRLLSVGSAPRPGKALEKDAETPTVRWNIFSSLTCR